MKCRGIQRKLALYVSDDLSRRWKAKIEEHLLTCSACRMELSQLKEALARLKEADASERQLLPEWNRNRWAELIEKISGFKAGREGRLSLAGVPWKKAVYRAAAVAGIASLILVAYFFLYQNRQESLGRQVASKESSEILKEKTRAYIPQPEENLSKEAQPQKQPSEKLATAQAKPGPAGQQLAAPPLTEQEAPAASLPERIEMVFKLPESGLQVVWILDRNFNLEGVKR